MHAVLRIDLQTRIAAIFFSDNLIHTGRAITLRRFIIITQIDLDRHGGIFQRQMRRLVFFMIGRRQKHGRQFIESHFAIRFGIINRLALRGFFQRRMVGLAVAQRKWQANAQSAHPHFCAAQNRADEIAEFRQKRLHIAHHFQFFGDT